MMYKRETENVTLLAGARNNSGPVIENVDVSDSLLSYWWNGAAQPSGGPDPE